MENGKKNNNVNSSNKTLETISMQLGALLEINKKQQEEMDLLKQRMGKLEEEKSAIEEARKEEPVLTTQTSNYDLDTDAFKADRMVEIIHLAERAQGITTTLVLNDGRTLTFRKYGDSIRVRYFEFQQLISTYYDLFYKERIFTLGKNDEDIALAERLPSFDEQCLTKDEVRSLLSLSPKQLEDIYNRVCDTHKQLILSTWQRGFFTNEDPEYRNVDKVNALNKVSGNKLSTVYDNITNPINKN